MQNSAGLEPAHAMDLDVDKATRKRVVTSTIIACGRYRFVLEGDAGKPEQAQSEIVALKSSLESLGLQLESVVARISRHQGPCQTYPGVEEGMVPNPNITGCGSLSIPNQGYSMTKQEMNESYEQAEMEVFTLPNATDYRFSTPDWTLGREKRQPYEEVYTCTSSTTLPNDSSGCPSVTSQEPSTSQGEETWAYDQEVWRVLDEPVFMLPSVKWTDDYIIDCIDEYWKTMSSNLTSEIVGKLTELARERQGQRVQNLYKDGEDLIKRIGALGPDSEGNKSQKMQSKVNSNTLPSIRAAGYYLSQVFEDLVSHVSELTNDKHGPVSHVSSLTAMRRLIEDGRKSLKSLGRWTDWMWSKMTAHLKDLKFQELTVERYLQKCAEIIPLSVNLLLNEEKRNFVSFMAKKTERSLWVESFLNEQKRNFVPFMEKKTEKDAIIVFR
ncbi:unnamed protein product [Calypogeia fissa]